MFDMSPHVLSLRSGLHQTVPAGHKGGGGRVAGGAVHLLNHHPQHLPLPHRRQGQEGHRVLHQEEA